MKEKEIGSGMEILTFLIGTWQTHGEIRAEANRQAIAFKGTDSYEWILNGNFILHKVDVIMGEEKTEVVEIIGGFDVKNKTYKMRSFDNQGVFMEMESYIDKKGVLHIVGADMRSQLVKQDQYTLIAHWERLADNKTWIPWMELQLSR
jgi:Protein of unknown function (DUF1579)